jgi:hypothetical protein
MLAVPALAMLLRVGTLTDAFAAAAPPCPEGAKYCFGIELFVVLEDGDPVQTAKWWAGEAARANDLFAAMDVGFELAGVHFIGGEWAHIDTRLTRDKLGRRDRTPGFVHVFMVRELDDVDIDGNRLYGVHWRDRGRAGQRWIILSARDGSATTFAHETGHYFGLPHSSYDVSIMNKSPRSDPPWPERVFAEPEVRRAVRHRDRMLAEKFLVRRKRVGD